jgi:hypothetical protein
VTRATRTEVPRSPLAGKHPWVVAVALAAAAAFAIWYIGSSRILETAPKPEDIVGTSWLVVWLEGDTDLPTMTISFAEDEIRIWTGCRHVAEGWGVDSDGLLLDVGPVLTSDPPCSGQAADNDGRLLDALVRVEGWSLTSSNAIELRSQDPIIRLQRQPR